MDSTPITTSRPCSQCASVNGTASNRRNKTANAATLLAVDRKFDAGAGAPWYTSGVQTWKGTKDSLNPKPTRINANPNCDKGPARPACARAEKARLPTSLYQRAMPNRMKAEPAPDNTRYFMAASSERRVKKA